MLSPLQAPFKRKADILLHIMRMSRGIWCSARLQLVPSVNRGVEICYERF